MADVFLTGTEYKVVTGKASAVEIATIGGTLRLSLG
jgi:hypothetical protein